jgi:acyl-CoA oxidase
VGNDNKGVHCFVVPVRDEKTGELLPGVTCGDCGPKAGLLQLDNAFWHFDNVRVPRENLLNKFGDVLENGSYVSSLTEGQRFAAVLGELVMGRTSLTGSSYQFCAAAISEAIRFSLHRR